MLATIKKKIVPKDALVIFVALSQPSRLKDVSATMYSLRACLSAQQNKTPHSASSERSEPQKVCSQKKLTCHRLPMIPDTKRKHSYTSLDLNWKATSADLLYDNSLILHAFNTLSIRVFVAVNFASTLLFCIVLTIRSSIYTRYVYIYVYIRYASPF